MKNTIKVVVKEPGKPFEVREVSNTLKQFQDIVGGHIEAVASVLKDTLIICNEEGRLLGLPEQVLLGGRYAGTVVLVGADGEDFTDAPEFVLSFFDGIGVLEVRYGR